MNHLSRKDYADALRLIAQLEAAAGDAEAFALASALALNRYVAAECAALVIWDRLSGQRRLFPLPAPAGLAPGAQAAGDDHALAVPLFTDGRTLVSIVLERHGVAFSRHERERLALLQPHLAFLYGQACRARATLAPAARPQADSGGGVLTQREAQVMHWLGFGKTDADIAALLCISRRTVQKHLEHIYVKLGVETRTAAVMRSVRARADQAAPVAMGEPGRALHSLQEPG